MKKIISGLAILAATTLTFCQSASAWTANDIARNWFCHTRSFDLASSADAEFSLNSIGIGNRTGILNANTASGWLELQFEETFGFTVNGNMLNITNSTINVFSGSLGGTNLDGGQLATVRANIQANNGDTSGQIVLLTPRALVVEYTDELMSCVPG